jgi:regulator of sigma E protease
MSSLFILLLSTGWVQFIQFFVALSILILIHEWGHYYAARRTGTRVEKFYLFFDFFFPFSTVLPFSLFKKKIGDTEYGLGWFPLGGYVKIAGMVDESMDKETMAAPPKPDEFRSKTAPQRLLIMLGGIIMNVILAIVVYTIMFGKYGDTYIANNKLKYGIACDSVALAGGLQDGDVITHVNGEAMTRFDQILPAVLASEGKGLTIMRNGNTTNLDLKPGSIKAMASNRKALFGIRIPLEIDSIPAELKPISGTLTNTDKIIAVNNTPITYYHEYKKAIAATQLTKEVSYTGLVKIIRNLLGKKGGKPQKYFDTTAVQSLTILNAQGDTSITKVRLNGDGSVGFYSKTPAQFISTDTLHYGFAQAIGKGFSYTWHKFTEYVGQFAMLFKSKEIGLSDSLGGFGTFVSVFPGSFNMEAFLELLAYISIILAFMNLLPIPGLDGGYVMFLLWELITGRKPNDKVMEVTTTIGLVLLLGLMLYANGLDVYRAVMR